MEKIVCPFMRKMCIECPIYRGRHIYYCLFERRGGEDVRRKDVHWDKNVLEELEQLARFTSVPRDLEDVGKL